MKEVKIKMREFYRNYREVAVLVSDNELDAVKNLITDAKDGAYDSTEDVVYALIEDGFEVIHSFGESSNDDGLEVVGFEILEA